MGVGVGVGVGLRAGDEVEVELGPWGLTTRRYRRYRPHRPTRPPCPPRPHRPHRPHRPPQYIHQRQHDMDREAVLTALDLVAELETSVDTHRKHRQRHERELSACAKILAQCVAKHAALLGSVRETSEAGRALAEDGVVQQAMQEAEGALSHARSMVSNMRKVKARAPPPSSDKDGASEGAAAEGGAFGAGARQAVEAAGGLLNEAEHAVFNAKVLSVVLVIWYYVTVISVGRAYK